MLIPLRIDSIADFSYEKWYNGDEKILHHKKLSVKFYIQSHSSYISNILEISTRKGAASWKKYFQIATEP